jgi:hypothetical protein
MTIFEPDLSLESSFFDQSLSFSSFIFFIQTGPVQSSHHPLMIQVFLLASIALPYTFTP